MSSVTVEEVNANNLEDRNKMTGGATEIKVPSEFYTTMDVKHPVYEMDSPNLQH